jgi:hypothetical protein
MSRQWVRVLAGKPGRGSIGYADSTWIKHGVSLTFIRFAKPFPYDFVGKSAKTFEHLTEAECDAMDLITHEQP